MTVTEAASNMYDQYFEQGRKCSIAEKDYDEGRLPLASFLEECFLLTYDCAKLGLPFGGCLAGNAYEAVSVLTRHWREFLDAIPEIKCRVLVHEGVEVKTNNQKLIIEARWREALDLVEAEYDYGDFEPRPQVLADPFFCGGMMA